MRLTASAVDWSLLGGVTLLVATGVAALLVGTPDGAWVVLVHGVAGLAVAGFLAAKLWRVRGRVTSGVPGVGGSLVLAALVVAALATGLAWTLGVTARVGPWLLLVVHMGLGVLVVPALAWHLRTRGYVPARDALGDRRDALTWLGVVTAGAVAYRTQELVNRVRDSSAADRRFTGSYERGSDAGNRFPVTAWVLDDPDPVEADAWSLRVTGAVREPATLGYEDLAPEAAGRALLDCTSGWYSAHDWQGVRVGELLDAAGGTDAGRWVQFRSVTGYRWSLPVAEARDALLATHVDGERLSHGHGFPARLVAPGRRGFQWVKWVEEVRVTRHRDVGEWVAIFVSGLRD